MHWYDPYYTEIKSQIHLCLCLSVSVSLCLCLSLVENIVLAYPPHHIFVILSVSYVFTCLTLPKPVCYCPFGMRSLIKLFKPNTSGKTWLISTRPNSFLQAHLAWALKQVWVTLSIFLCVPDTELCRGWQTRLKKKKKKKGRKKDEISQQPPAWHPAQPRAARAKSPADCNHAVPQVAEPIWI